MPGWRLLKRRIVEATPRLAKKYFEMQGCPNDRVLGESRLARLSKVIDSGEFRGCEWANVLCLENDQIYRVNGKHTSTDLHGRNPFPREISIVESDYEADDMEAVASLYATFDAPGTDKNGPDINWLVAGTRPELCELPKKVINLAVLALAFDKWEMHTWSKPPMEKALLILNEEKFCYALMDLMCGDCKNIKRGPVATAILRNFRKCQQDCLTFWTAVRDETGQHPTLPDRKLAKWLNRIRINIGASTKVRNKTETVTFHEVVVRCIQFFNLWRNGETVIKMPPYHCDKPIPSVV